MAPPETAPPGPASPDPAAHLLVDRLSVRFPDPRGRGVVEALRDVSLALPRGEIAAVLGPSGCGKTTLLNVVAGFLAPTEGRVAVAGRPVAGPGPERGMVFQQGALFEWMSVADNVAFGPRMRGVPRAERRDRVGRLLDVVGLAGFGDRAPYELSGGMQQRVALARCLANDPALILMDEPLGALDALTREKMQGLILEVWRETGTTILLITHSVEEALLLGRRLVVMAPRPGRIFREERLPFAEAAADRGAGLDLREIKRDPLFAQRREEVLSLIWDMEEEIMGQAPGAPSGTPPGAPVSETSVPGAPG